MKRVIYRKVARSLGHFVKDYAQRHRHPVNAALHLIGVPAVFYGLFQVTAGRGAKVRSMGALCIVLGYLLQYLGHRRQGNEVGEVSLIKFLLAKVKAASLNRMRAYNWSHGYAGDERREGEAVGSVKRSGKTNGNGDHTGNHGHGGNGNGSRSGRYIMWWKTSH